MQGASADLAKVTFIYAWVSETEDEEEVMSFHLVVTENQRQWLITNTDYSDCFLTQLERMVPEEFNINNPRYMLCLPIPTDEAQKDYSEILAEVDPEEFTNCAIDMRDCADVLD